MYYEKESGVGQFVAGLLIGAVLGASVALLSAPSSGKQLRTRLIRREALERPERDQAARMHKRKRRQARG